jgi:hypothetical protein
MESSVQVTRAISTTCDLDARFGVEAGQSAADLD